MSCSQVIQNFKSELLNNFIKNFKNETNNSLFIGIGRILPWNRNSIFEITDTLVGQELNPSDDTIVPITVDNDSEKALLRRNMFYLKEVTPNDFSFLVKNYEWENGVVYDNYRDNLPLFQEPPRRFFVYNKTNKCVYKCLDNNQGAISSSPPDELNSSIPFKTADGYTWKLMYSLSDDEEVKFSINGFGGLTEFIPVKYIDYSPTLSSEIQQKAFQDSSINGSIEFVDLNPEFKNFIGLDREVCTYGNEDRCFLFDDAATGSTTINLNLCTITRPKDIYDLIFSAINTNGIEIQRRIIDRSEEIITQFEENGGQTGICSRYIKIYLRNPTDRFLSAQETRYRIEPWIKVLGDGVAEEDTSVSTIGLDSAEFRPIFTHESDFSKISGVQVINRGKNYLYAKTFFPSIGEEEENLVGIKFLGPTSQVDNWKENTKNLLIPSLPPQGGHGSNPLKELGSSDLILKTIFYGNEENKLTPDNDFRQIFLLKNPILNNPKIHLRFSNIEPDENIQVGFKIFDGENSGTINKIYNYSGSTGFEIMVDSISGSFKDSSSITSSAGGAYQIDLSSRFSDHYKEYSIAGTENKNLMVVKTNFGNSFNGKIRDVVVGCGSTGEDGVYPSLASGMIRRLQNVGNEIFIFLEDFSGKFNENEKLLVIPKDSSQNPQIQLGKVLSSRYEKEENLNLGYSLITKIELSSQADSPFTSESFEDDQLIYSYENDTDRGSKSRTETIVGNGHLYSYQIIDQNTALIEVVGAKYQSFKVGHFVTYDFSGDPSYATINKVTESEINYDSGEVLYLNNLSPVTRSSSSRDEVNLVISL